MQKNIHKPKMSVRLGTTVLLLVAFAFGYLFGHANLQLDKRYIPRLVNTDLGRPSDVNFGLFWDIYNEVSQNYLKPIDAQKALYGAINGMVNSLDDPYSSFMTPDESASFKNDLNGKLEGIGAEIGRRNGVPSIIAPLEGSPAQKAGLKPGDKIIAVDNAYTENMSLNEVVLKIRGKNGTQVTLKILRQGEKDPRDITITREAINVDDVSYEVKSEIAVVTIRQFGDNSYAQLDKVAKEIKEKNIKYVIFDLRNNPGGLLDKAIDMLGVILPKNSVVVEQKPKQGNVEKMTTTQDPVLGNEKIAVLVNGGSASASEIFAGAIQDLHRGTVIGEKTFGKGTVQVLKDFDSGSALKLTIAQWLTPVGRQIDATGITPDIEVGLSDTDSDTGNDPQLDKAMIEVKKSK